jgi:hypothetical protein
MPTPDCVRGRCARGARARFAGGPGAIPPTRLRCAGLRARYRIRLCPAGGSINSPVVYLYVSDADAVRAEWASCGVEGRLGETRSTDYGMREFGFVDSGGTLHRVGSKLR